METNKELNKGRADTDYKKEDVIRVLLNIWKANPSLRLGQLIENATYGKYDLFYLEDSDLRDALIQYTETIK